MQVSAGVWQWRLELLASRCRSLCERMSPEDAELSYSRPDWVYFTRQASRATRISVLPALAFCLGA